MTVPATVVVALTPFVPPVIVPVGLTRMFPPALSATTPFLAVPTMLPVPVTVMFRWSTCVDAVLGTLHPASADRDQRLAGLSRGEHAVAALALNRARRRHGDRAGPVVVALTPFVPP